MTPGQLYSRTIGRIRLDVDPDHRGPSRVIINSGHNDQCQWLQNVLTVEELRDLRYLIDRGIAAAESYEVRRP